jgi:predicted O-methyltransferase YrrM
MDFLKNNIMYAIFRQKYKEYKSNVLKKKFNITSIKPVMKFREIEIIEDILKNLKPNNCLEWGAGYSTIYFPRFFKTNTTWLSIEHDENWAEKIQQLNKNPNIKIFLKKPNNYPWTDPFNDGSLSDLKDYIEFPARFGLFDFILIDGRARKDCLLKALEFINNKGIVILHDANRKYYHQNFKHYKHSIYFENYRPKSHGLFIGSKGISIESVLDVNKHKKLWRTYNKIGSLLYRLQEKN